MTEKKQIGDMKQGLTGSRPKLSILGRHGLIYTCRGHEYGGDKYARGNYYGPSPIGKDGQPISAVDRFMGYIDAAQRHLAHIAQAVNVAKGTGGDQRAAVACVDDEAAGGFPASMLPHMAHALASLFIGTEVAVMDGLLPADPGQPWVALLKVAGEALTQKDDAAAERARVAALAVAADERMKLLIEHRVRQGGYDIMEDFPVRPEAPL